MHDTEIREPSAGELAAMEGEVLPEWDRLLVRDFWDAVIAEELGAQVWPASVFADSAAERTRLHRVERRSEARVLRLVADVADDAVTALPAEFGEVA